jgi:hypothetical protein
MKKKIFFSLIYDPYNQFIQLLPYHSISADLSTSGGVFLSIRSESPSCTTDAAKENSNDIPP